MAVELIRLYHTPALDAFRGTPAGAILLGRVFAPINILVYVAGILAAAGLDLWVGRQRRRGQSRLGKGLAAATAI